MKTTLTVVLLSIVAAPAAVRAAGEDFDCFVNNWNVAGLMAGAVFEAVPHAPGAHPRA